MARPFDQVIILLQAESGDVLGGFLDFRLEFNSDKFYGTGECFLFSWSCLQNFEKEEAFRETAVLENEIVEGFKLIPQTSLPADKLKGHFEFFESTGDNSMYFYCDSDGFGFGSE